MINSRMIGNKIAEARKRAGVSQARLAGQLFISPQAVGKWERGESIPDILTIIRLAEILGVDLHYFSGGNESAGNEISTLVKAEKQSVDIPERKQKNRYGWDMSMGNWVDADFSGLRNLKEKFSSSNMLHCRFNGSDLSELLLKGNNVNSCDFPDSDLSRSRIYKSNLSGNNFRTCSLKEAEFLDSYVTGCDFSGTDFTGTVFKNGGFEKCSVTGAVFQHTHFISMHLAEVVFDGILSDCYFNNCAFTRVTFEKATLRNNFFKINKKLKGVRFIDCMADRMTCEFLKQCSADLTGVTMITD